MNSIHLIVESGPDRGRELTVPLDGARAGRSSSNDFVLNDPSLSRFHCRFYFKNDRDLAVSDLASTNDTLVNGRKIQDVQLFHGDAITIGETTIKVVQDTFLPGAGPVAAVTAPAPGQPASPTAPPSPVAVAPGQAPAVIDLGLQPDMAPPGESAGRLLPHFKGLIVAAGVTLLFAALLFVAFKAITGRRSGSGGSDRPSGPRQLELYYEKIEGDANNVFRYALQLQDGVLSVRVDNLEENRKMSREARPDPKVLDRLAEQLETERVEKQSFFDLEEEYTGMAPDVWMAEDLTVVINRRAHRCRVVNRVEPPVFKSVRVMIEEFGKAEVGLWALAMTPEKLRELAQDSWLLGQKLFDEREVHHENLFKAIRAFDEIEALLETVEPKPEYYAAALAARDECRQMIQTRYDDLIFQAERSMKVKDWAAARDHLQIIIQMIPDRTDERYDNAYKKLITVQRQLDR